MTKLVRDTNRKGEKADLSRARQRKLRRNRIPGDPSQAAPETNRRRSSRQRASSRSGPSVRERLVTSQIKIQTPSMQSIQGKLSSKLGQVYRQSGEYLKLGKTSFSGKLSTTRNSNRKSDNQRSKNLYESTPRTETQRKTNTDRPYMPRKNRRVYDAHSESAPPVMVRGGMGGMAFGRVATSRLHKQKTPRRRYDVPLKVQGAEVRLPSLPIFHFGWRAVSLMMVLMMATSLVLIWKAPVFQVKEVEAEGLKRLTVGDLNAVMGTFGSSVFAINPNSLKEALTQAFPELAETSVKINLPANVKVLVKEREPVIAWTQDGSEVWVDAEGVSFPPRGNPEIALVRVEGHGTRPGITSTTQTAQEQNLPPGTPSTAMAAYPSMRLTPKLVAALTTLGAKMPADTLLVYDSEHGLGWNDPNGWEVYFGAEDQDMEMKLKVYQTLVEHLQSEGIQPALISVEYVHAPYYRMER
jgi:cell division protein FtsQ